MLHIVIFILEFVSALPHLKHCYIIGTGILSVHPIIATHMSMGGYGKKAHSYIKIPIRFKNNLINIGCVTLYHLSMTYITVYNLSINSNYRILAAEQKCRFTKFTVLSNKTISRPLPIIVLQISAVK